MDLVFSGRLSVEKLTIAIADLPVSLKGTKLVQLSDFHYDGVRLSENLLAQAIEVTNQAEPDLILLTGDYVTDDPNLIYPLVQQLKHLESRTGIYAILGNHDLYYHRSKAQVTDALTSIEVQVLWNEVIYPLGSELPIVGLADFWSREFNPAPVMNQLDPKTPRIVLSHNPDSAEILQQWRVDLQLSGHTHGGQVIIPGLGPLPALLQRLKPHLHKSIPVLYTFHERVYKGSQALGMGTRTTSVRSKPAVHQSWLRKLLARTAILSTRSYNHHSGLNVRALS